VILAEIVVVLLWKVKKLVGVEKMADMIGFEL
jgi:hypothetical protein